MATPGTRLTDGAAPAPRTARNMMLQFLGGGLTAHASPAARGAAAARTLRVLVGADALQGGPAQEGEQVPPTPGAPQTPGGPPAASVPRSAVRSVRRSAPPSSGRRGAVGARRGAAPGTPLTVDVAPLHTAAVAPCMRALPPPGMANAGARFWSAQRALQPLPAPVLSAGPGADAVWRLLVADHSGGDGQGAAVPALSLGVPSGQVPAPLPDAGVLPEWRSPRVLSALPPGFSLQPTPPAVDRVVSNLRIGGRTHSWWPSLYELKLGRGVPPIVGRLLCVRVPGEATSARRACAELRYLELPQLNYSIAFYGDAVAALAYTSAARVLRSVGAPLDEAALRYALLVELQYHVYCRPLFVDAAPGVGGPPGDDALQAAVLQGVGALTHAHDPWAGAVLRANTPPPPPPYGLQRFVRLSDVNRTGKMSAQAASTTVQSGQAACVSTTRVGGVGVAMASARPAHPIVRGDAVLPHAALPSDRRKREQPGGVGVLVYRTPPGTLEPDDALGGAGSLVTLYLRTTPAVVNSLLPAAAGEQRQGVPVTVGLDGALLQEAQEGGSPSKRPRTENGAPRGQDAAAALADAATAATAADPASSDAQVLAAARARVAAVTGAGRKRARADGQGDAPGSDSRVCAAVCAVQAALQGTPWYVEGHPGLDWDWWLDPDTLTWARAVTVLPVTTGRALRAGVLHDAQRLTPEPGTYSTAPAEGGVPDAQGATLSALLHTMVQQGEAAAGVGVAGAEDAAPLGLPPHALRRAVFTALWRTALVRLGAPELHEAPWYPEAPRGWDDAAAAPGGVAAALAADLRWEAPPRAWRRDVPAGQRLQAAVHAQLQLQVLEAAAAAATVATLAAPNGAPLPLPDALLGALHPAVAAAHPARVQRACALLTGAHAAPPPPYSVVGRVEGGDADAAWAARAQDAQAVALLQAGGELLQQPASWAQLAGDMREAAAVAARELRAAAAQHGSRLLYTMAPPGPAERVHVVALRLRVRAGVRSHDALAATVAAYRGTDGAITRLLMDAMSAVEAREWVVPPVRSAPGSAAAAAEWLPTRGCYSLIATGGEPATRLQMIAPKTSLLHKRSVEMALPPLEHRAGVGKRVRIHAQAVPPTLRALPPLPPQQCTPARTKFLLPAGSVSPRAVSTLLQLLTGGDVVRPGCTLEGLLQHVVRTGGLPAPAPSPFAPTLRTLSLYTASRLNTRNVGSGNNWVAAVLVAWAQMHARGAVIGALEYMGRLPPPVTALVQAALALPEDDAATPAAREALAVRAAALLEQQQVWRTPPQSAAGRSSRARPMAAARRARREPHSPADRFEDSDDDEEEEEEEEENAGEGGHEDSAPLPGEVGDAPGPASPDPQAACEAALGVPLPHWTALRDLLYSPLFNGVTGEVWSPTGAWRTQGLGIMDWRSPYDVQTQCLTAALYWGALYPLVGNEAYAPRVPRHELLAYLRTAASGTADGADPSEPAEAAAVLAMLTEGAPAPPSLDWVRARAVVERARGRAAAARAWSTAALRAACHTVQDWFARYGRVMRPSNDTMGRDATPRLDAGQRYMNYVTASPSFCSDNCPPPYHAPAAVDAVLPDGGAPPLLPTPCEDTVREAAGMLAPHVGVSLLRMLPASVGTHSATFPLLLMGGADAQYRAALQRRQQELSLLAPAGLQGGAPAPVPWDGPPEASAQLGSSAAPPSPRSISGGTDLWADMRSVAASDVGLPWSGRQLGDEEDDDDMPDFSAVAGGLLQLAQPGTPSHPPSQGGHDLHASGGSRATAGMPTPKSGVYPTDPTYPRHRGIQYAMMDALRDAGRSSPAWEGPAAEAAAAQGRRGAAREQSGGAGQYTIDTPGGSQCTWSTLEMDPMWDSTAPSHNGAAAVAAAAAQAAQTLFGAAAAAAAAAAGTGTGDADDEGDTLLDGTSDTEDV